MTAPKLLLFYDESTQQPTEQLGRLPGLLMAGSQVAFSAALENSNLVFLQIIGNLRQEAIRLLLQKRKSFALLGLQPSDRIDNQRLRIAVRKKHLQVCWLGSLRFRQAAARLRELLNSGCLGEILHCQAAESENSPWTDYQTLDLLDWLLPGMEISSTRSPSDGNDDFSLAIQGSNGEAKIQLRRGQSDIFQVKFKQGTDKILACRNDGEASEIATLLFLHSTDKTWRVLAKPWSENK